MCMKKLLICTLINLNLIAFFKKAHKHAYPPTVTEPLNDKNKGWHIYLYGKCGLFAMIFKLYYWLCNNFFQKPELQFVAMNVMKCNI